MRSVILNEQSEKFDIYVYRKDENLFYCRESLYKLFEISGFLKGKLFLNIFIISKSFLIFT